MLHLRVMCTVYTNALSKEGLEQHYALMSTIYGQTSSIVSNQNIFVEELPHCTVQVRSYVFVSVFVVKSVEQNNTCMHQP